MGENKAESKWEETKGLHNINDITIGNAKGGINPVPECSTNREKVHGM